MGDVFVVVEVLFPILRIADFHIFMVVFGQMMYRFRRKSEKQRRDE
jgi:hypothetical protein